MPFLTHPGSNPGQPERDFESKYAHDSEEFRKNKEVKRRFQNWMRQWEAYRDQELGMGASLEDLGIHPEKERGLAGYNKLMGLWSTYGRTDPNFEYDWAGGQKRNRATSDRNAGWVPITAQEQYEKAQQERYGTHPGAYLDRLRSQQTEWISRAFGGPPGQKVPGAVSGGRNKTDRGLYYDVDPLTGRTTYYDPFGAITDEAGNRIGGAYGMGSGNGYRSIASRGNFGRPVATPNNGGIGRIPTPTGNPIQELDPLGQSYRPNPLAAGPNIGSGLSVTAPPVLSPNTGITGGRYTDTMGAPGPQQQPMSRERRSGYLKSKRRPAYDVPALRFG